ncbi:MAG: hypothetical protein P1P85_01200 [Patescibacteria group bacterium]|nr:hypothetical protein [Patescibacteria group bacterium]
MITKDIAKKITRISFSFLFVFLVSFFVLSTNDVSAQCVDYNLMQQGDGGADNNLDLVGFDASGDPVTSFFKFTPAADMLINKININLSDNSCFTSRNKVNVYISSNNWVINTIDLEVDNWAGGVVGNNILVLNGFVSLVAGTTYEINFEPIDLGGGSGVCKIRTDTNGQRTSSYIFPLTSSDVCVVGVSDSCLCASSPSPLPSILSYYNWTAAIFGNTCTQVDASCTEYDDCEVSEPNTKLYNPNGFLSVSQKWNQYMDYPDIELMCAPPSFCGDDVIQAPNDAGTGGPANDGNEQCDGIDNNACLGYGCDTDCTCNTYCGDNIAQIPNDIGLGGPANDGNEQCDGTDATFCGGLGCSYCKCNPDPLDCTSLFDNSGGLVPCGRITDNLDTVWNETESCNICHSVVLASNVINFLMELIILITILSIIVAGFIHVKTGGDSNLLLSAKQYMNKIVFGFVVVFVAWTIINTGMVLFGFNDPLGDGSWARFDCNLNTVPTFCGDGIVNGLEVCDYNAPAPFGIRDCEDTFFDGMPAHCTGVPVAGTQNCNQCCSGWEACTALPPTPVGGTSSACDSTSVARTGYACCELVGCGKDGCNCCGRGYTIGMPGPYVVVQEMRPCGGVGGYNCRLGQDPANLQNWYLRTNHTTATFRCWK